MAKKKIKSTKEIVEKAQKRAAGRRETKDTDTTTQFGRAQASAQKKGQTTFVRPAETDPSRNVETTDLPELETMKIRSEAREEGLERRAGNIIQSQERTQDVLERLGTEPFKEELEEDIAQPPDLQGSLVGGVTEDIAEQTLKPVAGIGNLITAGLEGVTGKEFGRVTADNLADTLFGKALGTLIGATGAALVGIAGAAAVTALTAKAAATVIGAKAGALIAGNKLLIGSVVGITVGGTITDLNRGEIQTMKGRITKMVELGERIEASVRNGLDANFAIEQLRDMSQSIDESEAALKQLSLYNIRYRTGNEYLLDQEAIIGARTSILRRVEAIENIKIQGTAALDPEALMLNVS